MTKYWAFARGGAWCNPKPTGGPYVCEQCRLDACGGNDATLIMQAVTTIELAPADVCADCGARLLEELEVHPHVCGENVNSASPGSARSRPGREAAERTLDGEDRFGIIRNEGKGDNSKGSQTGGGGQPPLI